MGERDTLDACINGPAIGLLVTAATGLVAAFGTLFWQVIKAKDAHITYLQNVNADLTENQRAAHDIADGAVTTVRRSAARERPGR